MPALLRPSQIAQYELLGSIERAFYNEARSGWRLISTRKSGGPSLDEPAQSCRRVHHSLLDLALPHMTTRCYSFLAAYLDA